MSVKVEYGGGDYFGLRFPYHRHFVRCVHGLNNRRWDPSEKCWYIHLSHLPEVMQLFQISKQELPERLWRAYQIYRIRTSRLRVHVGTTTARIEGDRFPVEEVVQATSYVVPGHQFTPAFQEGRWDAVASTTGATRRFRQGSSTASSKYSRAASGFSRLSTIRFRLFGEFGITNPPLSCETIRTNASRQRSKPSAASLSWRQARARRS